MTYDEQITTRVARTNMNTHSIVEVGPTGDVSNFPRTPYPYPYPYACLPTGSPPELLSISSEWDSEQSLLDTPTTTDSDDNDDTFRQEPDYVLLESAGAPEAHHIGPAENVDPEDLALTPEIVDIAEELRPTYPGRMLCQQCLEKDSVFGVRRAESLPPTSNPFPLECVDKEESYDEFDARSFSVGVAQEARMTAPPAQILVDISRRERRNAYGEHDRSSSHKRPFEEDQCG